jgi:hypothetical protein
MVDGAWVSKARAVVLPALAWMYAAALWADARTMAGPRTLENAGTMYDPAASSLRAWL